MIVLMSAASLESNLDSLQGFFHPDAESHWWASLTMLMLCYVYYSTKVPLPRCIGLRRCQSNLNIMKEE